MATKDLSPQQAQSEISRLRAQVEQLSQQLADAELRLKEMGISDPITGLFSYRYFLGRITEEVSRADRFGLEVSCMMLRLDTGSFEGLLEVAKLLKDTCRQYDIPARWGQNELAMLFPATDVDGATTFAERFRILVEKTYADHPALGGLTISAGLASYPVTGVENAQQLIESADTAMHKAVSAGGNRTVVRT